MEHLYFKLSHTSTMEPDYNLVLYIAYPNYFVTDYAPGVALPVSFLVSSTLAPLGSPPTASGIELSSKLT